MNEDEVASLKARHASEIRDLEHRLKNEFFADALDLELKVRALEGENQALTREVEKLRAKGQSLSGVISLQTTQLDGHPEQTKTDRANPDEDVIPPPPVAAGWR